MDIKKFNKILYETSECAKYLEDLEYFRTTDSLEEGCKTILSTSGRSFAIKTYNDDLQIKIIETIRSHLAKEQEDLQKQLMEEFKK